MLNEATFISKEEVDQYIKLLDKIMILRYLMTTLKKVSITKKSIESFIDKIQNDTKVAYLLLDEWWNHIYLKYDLIFNDNQKYIIDFDKSFLFRVTNS